MAGAIHQTLNSSGCRQLAKRNHSSYSVLFEVAPTDSVRLQQARGRHTTVPLPTWRTSNTRYVIGRFRSRGISRSRFLGRGCDEALFGEKKGFSVKGGGGNSVNGGFGKDFNRNGDSVKSSGRFSEPPDSGK